MERWTVSVPPPLLALIGSARRSFLPALPRLVGRQINVIVDLRGWTDILQNTLLAVGVDRGAGLSAVANEKVGVPLPVVFRHQLHQLCFDRFGPLLFGDAESPRKPLDVGVDDDALDDLVAVLEDDVGGLSADTRQFGQRVHRIRHVAVVVVDDGLAGRADVARLVVVVGHRVEILRELLLVSVRVVGRAVVLLEEVGGD